MARHQNEFSPSFGRNVVKRRNESIYLRLASIELFRDQYFVRNIARADGKSVNLPVCLPCCEAGAQICLEARRGLKPILR